MPNIKERKVAISVKTNATDKEEATKLFDSLGLNLSTAINIFLKKSIAEGGLPFEVRDPFYSETNQKELDRRFAVINENKNVHSHRLLDNEKNNDN
ncbi:type II toxin-antitoxin system RelB/DinJ family antitoxin [Lactobacillus sp. ESL0791]|uniref:type II toxin-antitoxin system RelB/DinJ family antitoxin n=1 Tax=Lactobacillus sp. ESL0791 TaxID=2983234 RepID=UPI0023F8509E|nr:type II toxin-antitoxin system RelB/DinJ family antitoxin [Lactobacillus sp. ESL0791]MDF7639842.1 type II toxin-antitoxin system RelB/DinJ family antitoxin [Lactobacillus sp. ESL0791]